MKRASALRSDTSMAASSAIMSSARVTRRLGVLVGVGSGGGGKLLVREAEVEDGGVGGAPLGLNFLGLLLGMGREERCLFRLSGGAKRMEGVPSRVLGLLRVNRGSRS